MELSITFLDTYQTDFASRDTVETASPRTASSGFGKEACVGQDVPGASVEDPGPGASCPEVGHPPAELLTAAGTCPCCDGSDGPVMGKFLDK